MTAVASRRTLHKLRASKLGDLAGETFACVTGRVVPVDNATLVTPLTGRPCLFFRTSVRHFKGELLLEEQLLPFLLDDGSGRALVMPGDAHVWCRYDIRWHGIPSERERVLRWLPARVDDRHRYWLTFPGALYREAIIMPGATVTVCGAGVHEPDPETPRSATDYRTGYTMRLRFEASATSPLYIANAASADAWRDDRGLPP